VPPASTGSTPAVATCISSPTAPVTSATPIGLSVSAVSHTSTLVWSEALTLTSLRIVMASDAIREKRSRILGSRNLVVDVAMIHSLCAGINRRGVVNERVIR